MNNEHPIAPPEELVDQWNEAWIDAKVKHEGLVTFVANQAARWGADQELEACCEILRGEFNYHHLVEPLRAARRPKPPSLKEQALAVLDHTPKGWGLAEVDLDTIRRALESLPE